MKREAGRASRERKEGHEEGSGERAEEPPTKKQRMTLVAIWCGNVLASSPSSPSSSSSSSSHVRSMKHKGRSTQVERGSGVAQTEIELRVQPKRAQSRVPNKHSTLRVSLLAMLLTQNTAPNTVLECVGCSLLLLVSLVLLRHLLDDVVSELLDKAR